MPKKKFKKRVARAVKNVADEFSIEKKELEALRGKREELAALEVKELSKVKGFKKTGVFIKGLARRASLNKQINRRRQLISGGIQIRRLEQQKKITQLKKDIAGARPKPITLEDINKPIESIKSEDIFKPL